MTKWIKNFIGAAGDGDAGICPKCGSSDTGYVIVQNPAFIEVWCNSCLEMDSMSFYGTPELGRNVMTGDEYADWEKGTKHHQALTVKLAVAG
jgi:hypothetical protein